MNFGAIGIYCIVILFNFYFKNPFQAILIIKNILEQFAFVDSFKIINMHMYYISAH